MRPALAMHTPRPLHHDELLVRGMINLNRLHPKAAVRGGVCVCVQEGVTKLCVFKLRGSLCFFSSSSSKFFFPHSRDRKSGEGAGERGEEGLEG